MSLEMMVSMEINNIEDIEKLNKKEDVFTELNVLTEQENTIQLLESQIESLTLLVTKQDSIIKKFQKLINSKKELFSLFDVGLADKE